MGCVRQRQYTLIFPLMPLVTVKQPDGTYAKISLEEFMKRQSAPALEPSNEISASSSPSPVTPAASLAAELPGPDPLPSLPVSPKAGHLSLPKPLPSTVPSVPRKDQQAFLDDLSAPTAKRTAPTPGQEMLVDKVLQRAGLTVSEEYLPRLRSVIEMRLKGVRDEAQTKRLVERSFAEGGLELAEREAEQLLSACALQEEVLVPGEQKMAAATPFNAFKHAPKDSLTASSSTMSREEVGMPKREPIEALLAEKNKSRPIVTDVIYRPIAIGPVEEIQTITLTDFRRLSPVTNDAALRLEQKFSNLKGESVVLFLEALDAWRQSPLYQEYTDRVLHALLHRSPLDATLRKTKSLTLEEVAALVGMEKRLTL